MATRIIDSSRPLPPTHEDYQDALALGEGDTLILAAGAEIAAYGYGAAGIYGGDTLLIDGRVYSHQSSAIWVLGTVHIGMSGTISGGENGLRFGHGSYDKANVLNNYGKVYGVSAGVYLDGTRNIINNSGEIVGDTGIYQFYSSDPGESLIINNTGIIKGTGGIAILGTPTGPNVITNRGVIEGDVITGGNGWTEPAGPTTHIYDGRGGTISGVVRFFSGDDVAYGGDGSETFVMGANTNFVDGGDGIDTLIYDFKATVDLRITSKQQTGKNAWDTIQNIENLNGSWANDRFIGNTTANTLMGNSGNDTLDGYDGNDLLSGGTGNNLLVGGAGSDIAVFSGQFSDYTITVGAGSITIADKRASGDGIDFLGGVEFALFSDRVYTLSYSGSPPASVPTTPTSPTTPAVPDASSSLTPELSLKLVGGKKVDTFIGGTGDDYLNGGLGRDILTGGEGKDVFVFSTKLKNNVDAITDFTAGDDMIQLSKAIFSKIGKGALKKSAFHIGTKAKDAKDRIIFNEKTGAVSYDADGSGKKFAAVKFAQLEAGASLSASDFWVL